MGHHPPPGEEEEEEEEGCRNPKLWVTLSSTSVCTSRSGRTLCRVATTLRGGGGEVGGGAKGREAGSVGGTVCPVEFFSRLRLDVFLELFSFSCVGKIASHCGDDLQCCSLQCCDNRHHGDALQFCKGKNLGRKFS